MADNKKHHYVPRFLIRNFSSDKNGRCIRLFNIKRTKIVSEAPISGQCYRDYFYGKQPRLEKIFGDLEGRASQIFRNAIQNDTCPAYGMTEFLDLVTFIALQLGRTEAAEDEMNENVNKLAKYLLAHNPEILPDLDKIDINLNNAVMFPLLDYMRLSPILLDLDFKLLKATSDCEFILSDNPAIMFNQYFEDPKILYTTGLASRGLLICLPISRSHALLFYDKALYKVGKNNEQVIRVFPIDVRQLNVKQYLSARENIYFGPASMDKEIEALHQAHHSSRLKEQSVFDSHTIASGASGSLDFLRLSKRKLPLHSPLRCVSIIGSKKRRITPGVRDEAWVQIVKDFTTAVEKKEMPYSTFPEFVENHPLSQWPNSKLLG